MKKRYRDSIEQTDKVEFTIELDRDIYEYARKRRLLLSDIINKYLRQKFKLGKYDKKPRGNYPLELSVKYGVDYYKTDINDPLSVISLVNRLLLLYPQMNEETMFPAVNKELIRRDKYGEFCVSQRYRMNK